MTGAPEFLQQVGGGSGQPLATNATGTVETDNYTEAGSFAFDGSTYPEEVNPPELMEEIIITTAGDQLKMDFTTASGDTVTDFEILGNTLAMDTLEVDSFTIKDPNGSGAAFKGMWIGE